MDSQELRERSQALAERQAQMLERESTPLRFQPGEDPESRYLDDAIHWATVYSELARFKHDMIRRIEQYLSDAAEPHSRDELLRDQQAVQLELERVRLHLEYWRGRQTELAPEPS